ncbi:alpha-L-fucosidase [Bowdeniella nasicola]|uniref:alpha-L-fucosidase n=1 Tax=Bowdeniella nasicola TaxID=208480 RepID=A0A1Q5Q0E9_9ACTO|nr:alpha-L-fucosidase [Bowdeniella nasicola]OKL53363.1 alpha-L-fucosidase [Bowdeniella nasicola]
MFNFEDRTGPRELAACVSYPEAVIPDWYRDAKLGFFIHLGLYSVPAWAYRPVGPYSESEPDPTPIELAYSHHRYAEWYGNTWRLPHSPCRRFHENTFGVGTHYEDFADSFTPRAEHLTALVDSLVAAGGRYIVPTTKHHDGYCLWDSATTGFTSVKRAAGLDVIDVIASATRAAGARLGLYFSGALDWHVSDFPAINSDTDLFAFRRNDPEFARYAAAQLSELIDRFSPDLLWNDIEWPDGGKGPDGFGLAGLLSDYYERFPEGVINDRWGIPHHGFLTREYSHVPEIMPNAWEATRGLGRSFGYNANEDPADRLSATDLIHLLLDVCAKGGNLLINVGPRADGSLDDYQAAVVASLGEWMSHYGELLYSTRPAPTFTSDSPGDLRFVTRPGEVIAFVRDRTATELRLPEFARASTGTWHVDGGVDDAVLAANGIVPIPPATTDTPLALVLKATTDHVH